MSLGKLRPGVMTAANKHVPHFVNKLLADRSFDWWIMSEDLPDPNNRISVDGGRIKMGTRRNNLRAHQELTKRAAAALRRAGLPLILTKLMPVATTSHQCGTVRFGTDPAKAALDPFCRAFDQQNLFVIDASFFPSSAAVNPALTIAAQALRAADHMAAVDFGISPKHYRNRHACHRKLFPDAVFQRGAPAVGPEIRGDASRRLQGTFADAT
jgi:choline dehydrogenase-like flavoprotein